MSTPARSLGGVTAQVRVADRRRRLLDAALDVVGERGVADFTMTAVCRGAGLTERYFYESFDRREDLLVALFDTSAQTALEAARAAADACPADALEARTHAAIATITDLLAHDPRAARLYREAVGRPELAARRQDTVRAFADLLAGLVLDAHPGLDPEAVATSALVVVAGVVDAVGFWLEDRIPTTVDGLVTRCARMVVAVADQLATEQEDP